MLVDPQRRRCHVENRTYEKLRRRGTVAAPSFSPPVGTYSSTQTVTISTATSGATIRYTVDGSTPTASSTVYTGPISVPTSRTVNAIATKSGSTDSPVSSASYTIG